MDLHGWVERKHTSLSQANFPGFSQIFSRESEEEREREKERETVMVSVSDCVRIA